MVEEVTPVKGTYVETKTSSTAKKNVVALTHKYSIIDSDDDNSFELDSDVLGDATVLQNLDYIKNITLSNIIMAKGDIKEFNRYRQEFELFLIQFLVDGFSANCLNRTLNNDKMDNVKYVNNDWHILYKTNVITSFTDVTEVTRCISTKEFAGDEYSEEGVFVSNEFLVARKAPIVRKTQLEELVELKTKIKEVLNIAIEKNAIPTLIMKSDVLDEESKSELLEFLSTYKNASASVVNSDFIRDLIVIESKTNSELIFKTFQLINNEISALLGCSLSIFEAKGTELATSRTIDKVVLRNINNYKIFMEGVINEIAEKNSLGFQIELPQILVDEYIEAEEKKDKEALEKSTNTKK